MTIKILLGDEIRSEVLKILSGRYLFDRRPDLPSLHVLSPWISDVQIELSDRAIDELRSSLLDREPVADDFFFDYNIRSINLPYALLLLKLHEGAIINIVTLPPDETSYSSDYQPRVKALLEFLDEIGCNIFVSSKLHSKLLVANDLALLGSFNLSSSALYYKEEIGVSVNDLDNLQRLEIYCKNVIRESQPYGYTSSLNWGTAVDRSIEASIDYSLPLEVLDRLFRQQAEAYAKRRFSLVNQGVTRGWLLDYLINETFLTGERRADRYGEFFDVTQGYDRFIESYSTNLDLFYLVNLRRLISSDEGRALVTGCFGYEGDESMESVLRFVKSKFARKDIPDIGLRIEPLFSKT